MPSRQPPLDGCRCEGGAQTGERIQAGTARQRRWVTCEHVFVTSQGSAYSRFQRALATGNMPLIESSAAELPRVGVDDALAILIVLAQVGDPRFDRAAARWVGRLLTETPAGLSDARFALALVERLPDCRDALHRLTRRR